MNAEKDVLGGNKASQSAISTLQGTQGQPLSYATKGLIWVGLPSMVVGVWMLSPLTASLIPALLVPTLCLVWWDRAQPANQRTDIETFIWTYVLAGTLGTTVVIIIQSILSYIFALALFQADAKKFFVEFQRNEADIASLDAETLATRRQMAASWQNWTFNLLLAFAVAGTVEECLKYSALALARRYGRILHERNYTILAAAGAMGFGTFEGIGFIYAATKAIQGPGGLALAVAERIIIGPPMHAVGAVLIGLNTARRDFHGESLGFANIIALSLLFHGLSDFCLFSFSALDGNVGWVHPYGKRLLLVYGVVLTVHGTLIGYVRRRLLEHRFSKVNHD
ncbi:hypothetical protein F4809DRAFT_214254 [Biscogniauxia mediterranea]|nr:hypothetical protein F4809DRAFT_214254 [Biscogniauxia mediterranea]